MENLIDRIIAGELHVTPDGAVYEHEVWLRLEKAKKQEEQFDLLQLTKKISMNSLYGALLNNFFRFGDERMGASVTATGRAITTHMIETVGEFLTERRDPLVKTSHIDKDGHQIHEYHSDSEAIIYGDTDSVDGQSIINTSLGKMSISKLFNMAPIKWNNDDKQFAAYHSLVSTCFDSVHGVIEKEVKAIYRHRVSKPKFKITLENGQSVVVTSDHSIMVNRRGVLLEVKPSEINRDTDYCISIG